MGDSIIPPKADNDESIADLEARMRGWNLSQDELADLTQHIEGWKDVNDLFSRIDAWFLARYNSLPH